LWAEFTGDDAVETRELEKKVIEFMRAEKMAESGDGILAAVSGGADSVCLLFLLHKWQEELGIRLAAFHLNHGLRGAEADRDEAYVRELCEKLQVPFLAVREDVAAYAASHKLSCEEAGRTLRYFHLERAAETFSCNKIATAHHRDDNAETVLLNLFRGSGFRGLSGISPVRGRIIRPLLGLSREEIAGYLRENGIEWCEDSTNREDMYARNRIRNGLLPWVRENINGGAAGHILNFAALAGQADEYFTRQAEILLPEGAVSIRTEDFDRQPEILKSYLVRRMIAGALGSEKDVSMRHIHAVCALKGPGGGTEADLPGGFYALRSYDTLEIRKRTDGILAKQDGMSYEYRIFSWKKDREIPKNQYTKWFDYDKIKGTLSVRSRETGDYLTIRGGKRKLLKRFFIDEKIPEEKRDSIRLLAEGNHVLWVVGYRISEFYKITDETQTILEVIACKGEENG